MFFILVFLNFKLVGMASVAAAAAVGRRVVASTTASVAPLAARAVSTAAGAPYPSGSERHTANSWTRFTQSE